jgi:hypothetical protein
MVLGVFRWPIVFPFPEGSPRSFDGDRIFQNRYDYLTHLAKISIHQVHKREYPIELLPWIQHFAPLELHTKIKEVSRLVQGIQGMQQEDPRLEFHGLLGSAGTSSANKLERFWNIRDGPRFTGWVVLDEEFEDGQYEKMWIAAIGSYGGDIWTSQLGLVIAEAGFGKNKYIRVGIGGMLWKEFEEVVSSTIILL